MQTAIARVLTRSPRISSSSALTIVLLAIIFFATIRYRLRDMPLERDEGEYAYSGQLMLQGIPPYKLAYNRSCPESTPPTPAFSPHSAKPLPPSISV